MTFQLNIQYAPGESPTERIRSGLIPDSTGRLQTDALEQARFWREPLIGHMTSLMRYAVEAANMLVSPLEISRIYYRNRVIDRTIQALVSAIIEDLEVFPHNPNDPVAYQINRNILERLKQLQKDPALIPRQVLTILAQMDVPGVERIEIRSDVTPNDARLQDMGYPQDQIPEAYMCSVGGVIMSDPCQATPTEMVDRSVVDKTPSNPFTRERWPAKVPSDVVLAHLLKIRDAFLMNPLHQLLCTIRGFT
jgi:hypothetical protein